uniref:Transposase n=1 Tax=Romanomermis culicivorax TaxID=13658 RepID=A0A915HT67_ROMCU
AARLFVYKQNEWYHETQRTKLPKISDFERALLEMQKKVRISKTQEDTYFSSAPETLNRHDEKTCKKTLVNQMGLIPKLQHTGKIKIRTTTQTKRKTPLWLQQQIYAKYICTSDKSFKLNVN